MKRTKMFLTGIAVLGVVGSALAFSGKFAAGTVFCFAQGTVINTSQSCAVQSFTTHPHLKVDANGTITTPCTGTDFAQDNATGVCLNPTVQKYSSTGLE